MMIKANKRTQRSYKADRLPMIVINFAMEINRQPRFVIMSAQDVIRFSSQ